MYTYHLCRVFRALYGWFERKVLYFNTHIHVYHIMFTDETKDYVSAEDFDGIDLIFIVTFLLSLCFLYIH